MFYEKKPAYIFLETISLSDCGGFCSKLSVITLVSIRLFARCVCLTYLCGEDNLCQESSSGEHWGAGQGKRIAFWLPGDLFSCKVPLTKRASTRRLRAPSITSSHATAVLVNVIVNVNSNEINALDRR